jgi:hypothetical protein
MREKLKGRKVGMWVKYFLIKCSNPQWLSFRFIQLLFFLYILSWLAAKLHNQRWQFINNMESLIWECSIGSMCNVLLPNMSIEAWLHLLRVQVCTPTLELILVWILFRFVCLKAKSVVVLPRLCIIDLSLKGSQLLWVIVSSLRSGAKVK